METPSYEVLTRDNGFLVTLHDRGDHGQEVQAALREGDALITYPDGTEVLLERLPLDARLLTEQNRSIFIAEIAESGIVRAYNARLTNPVAAPTVQYQ